MSERVPILPLTEHPLTVSGLPDSAVETIARLIHTFRDVGIRYARPAIAAIIAYNDFRWMEIEDYVSEYGPKYAAALSEIMAKRVPEDDAIDKAFLSLHLHFDSFWGFDVLEYPRASSISLGERDYELLLRHHERLPSIEWEKDQVYESPKYMIPAFMALVERGYAIPGKEVQPSAFTKLLGKRQLKELNSLIADTHPPGFKRKAAMLDALFDLPNTLERIGKCLDLGRCFQITVDPPVDYLRLSELFSNLPDRVIHLASLFVDTYIARLSAIEHLRWTSEAGFEHFNIIHGDDGSTCAFCLSVIRKHKVWHARELPTFPLHPGCQCSPMAVPDD